MLERKTLYSLDYYKKNTFMGSIGEMNFRIYKVEKNTEEDKQEESKQEETDTEPEKYLEAVCWKGPYIFSKTPDEDKIYMKQEYSEEGITNITTWLNEQYVKMYGEQ